MQYVAVACRTLLAVVFLASLAGKIARRGAYRDFVSSLRRMAVVASPLVPSAAMATVVAEGLIVASLVVPLRWAAAVGFAAAVGLLVVFCLAIASALRHGHAEPCQCFGRSETPLGVQHIVRNMALLVVGLLGLWGALSTSGASTPGTLLALVAGLFVGVVITALDDILAVLRPQL